MRAKEPKKRLPLREYCAGACITLKAPHACTHDTCERSRKHHRAPIASSVWSNINPPDTLALVHTRPIALASITTPSLPLAEENVRE